MQETGSRDLGSAGWYTQPFPGLAALMNWVRLFKELAEELSVIICTTIMIFEMYFLLTPQFPLVLDSISNTRWSLQGNHSKISRRWSVNSVDFIYYCRSCPGFCVLGTLLLIKAIGTCENGVK